jgi:hypothetical protein
VLTLLPRAAFAHFAGRGVWFAVILVWQNASTPLATRGPRAVGNRSVIGVWEGIGVG